MVLQDAQATNGLAHGDDAKIYFDRFVVDNHGFWLFDFGIWGHQFAFLPGGGFLQKYEYSGKGGVHFPGYKKPTP